MLCPKCRLINPDSALLCDCGYDFRTGVARPGPSVVSVSAGLRWLVAGLFGAAILSVAARHTGHAHSLGAYAVVGKWFLYALAQACTIGFIVVQYRLAVAIGETQPWVYVVAAFVPVVCLIALIVLISRTYTWLRANGGYRMRA